MALWAWVWAWLHQPKAAPPPQQPALPLALAGLILTATSLDIGRLVLSAPQTNSIFTVGMAGTGEADLGVTGKTPSWTPDGRVIYAGLDGSINLIGADGSGGKAVNTSLSPGTFKPQLANGVIVASSNGGIWAMAEDGSNLRRLVNGGWAAFLAPSGKWLTYTMPLAAPDGNQIFRINVDGTGNQQLTFLGDATHPNGNASAISPDEQTIALFWGPEATAVDQSVFTWGHRDVAVMPANGGTPRVVVAAHLVSGSQDLAAFPKGACVAADNPAWSPDGKQILYDCGTVLASPEGGTHIVDLSGANDHQVSQVLIGGSNVPLR
jgi:Tol biopolymer transport system component